MFLDCLGRQDGILVVEPCERDAFGRIVEPLRRALGADMAMVSYLSQDHHHVVHASGFALPPEANGRVTHDYSICLHAVEMDFPLVVDDAHQHPLLTDNRTIEEFGVAAYLGVPIHLPGGPAIGTVCAMQLRPRRWQSREIGLVITAAGEIDALLRDWDADR